MARVEKFAVANPTREDLETSKTKIVFKAGHVKIFEVDTESGKNVDDLLELIDRGCTVGPGQLKNKVSEYKGKLKSIADLLESGAHLLESLARPVLSAGSDTHAASGL